MGPLVLALAGSVFFGGGGAGTGAAAVNNPVPDCAIPCCNTAVQGGWSLHHFEYQSVDGVPKGRILTGFVRSCVAGASLALC